MSLPTQVREYEEEVATLVENIRRDIAKLKATFPDPTKPAAEIKPVSNRQDQVSSITASCKRLATTVADLETESAEVPTVAQSDLKLRIKGYKATLASLEKDRDAVKKLSAEADMQDLTRNAISTSQKAIIAAAGVGANDDEATRKMKQTLAHNAAKQQDTVKILGQMQSTLGAAHNTADATLDELERQKRTQASIAATTGQMDQELTQVQRVLRKMQKELLKSKLMLAAVIAILVIAIIGLLYYKFGGSGGNSATSTVNLPTTDDTNAPAPVGSTPAPLVLPPVPTDASRRRQW